MLNCTGGEGFTASFRVRNPVLNCTGGRGGGALIFMCPTAVQWSYVLYFI